MLLIDGVKYELWTPSSEDEFEWVMKAHTEDIFGEESIYFNLRKKLITKAGIGSIPDGYVINVGGKPEIRIIELELASHSLQHIVSQLVNIINGIENSTMQQKICNAIEDGINEDEIFVTKMEKAIKPLSIHRFLSDSFSSTIPIINIVIDKSSSALAEAIQKITPRPEIIEFQTFTREGVGLAVHAHLFEPLYVPKVKKPDQEKLSAGDVVGFSRINQSNINYHYIDIDMIIRSAFPADKVRFTLETTAGQVHTNVAGTVASSPYIQRNLKEWFDAHPELKTGDVVNFTVIEPMKRYRLELEKRLI